MERVDIQKPIIIRTIIITILAMRLAETVFRLIASIGEIFSNRGFLFDARFDAVLLEHLIA
jgi:hypothetical protein